MLFELVGHLVLHMLGKRLHNTAVARFFTGVRQLFLALVFAAMAAACASIAMSQNAELRTWGAHGVRASATITEKTAMSAAPRRSPTYQLAYTFTTQTGETIVSTARVSADIYNSAQIGEQTPVVYPRDNPKRSQLGTYRFDYAWLAAIWGGAAVLAGMSLSQLAWFVPWSTATLTSPSQAPLLLPRLPLLAIAATIAVYTGQLSWQRWQQETDLARNRVPSEAVVDQRWMERSNLTSTYRVSYRMRTRDGSEITGEARVPHAAYLRLAPGTRTQGFYSSRAPQSNGIGGIGNMPRGHETTMMLAYAAIASAALALWQAKKLIAMRRERRRIQSARDEILAAGIWNQPEELPAGHAIARSAAAMAGKPAGKRQGSQVVERVPSLMARIFG